jgi:hypothetical protein
VGKAGRANQQRDKRGRFARKGGGESFASRGLAALKSFKDSKYAKPAGRLALAVGATMLHKHLANRHADREVARYKQGGGPALPPHTPEAKPTEATKAAKSGRARSMSIGGGVRLAGKELDTLISTVDRGLTESRNHGFVARGYQQLRTAKALETKGMLRRQAHPEGASDTDKRFPNFVPTDAAIDALKKAGHLSSENAMKWRNSWKKPGRDL